MQIQIQVKPSAVLCRLTLHNEDNYFQKFNLLSLQSLAMALFFHTFARYSSFIFFLQITFAKKTVTILKIIYFCVKYSDFVQVWNEWCRKTRVMKKSRILITWNLIATPHHTFWRCWKENLNSRWLKLQTAWVTLLSKYSFKETLLLHNATLCHLVMSINAKANKSSIA